MLTKRLIELESELFASREHLQTQVEQLEIVNEELQSLNEELESSNEEFNATNEELEVSNEELQSSYEELNAANQRLGRLNKQLDDSRLKLKRREANFKAMLNNKLQAVILLGKNGEVKMLNETAVRVFKNFNDSSEFRGKKLSGLIPENVGQTFKKCIEICLIGDSYTDKVELQALNGDLKHYAVNATPVTLEHGVVTGISLAMLEITNLNTALKKMEEKDQIISSVFNVAAVGMCITDENSVFVDCNQKFLDIYGYRRDEIVGQSIAVLVPDTQAKKVIQLNRDYLSGIKESNAANFTVLKKDGTEIIIEAAQRIFEKQNGNRYLVTSIREVTENIKAAEVESKANELLQWSERISKSGSWEFEQRTGTVRLSAGLSALLEVDFLTSRKGVEAILNFTREDLRSVQRSTLKKALETQDDFDFEITVVSKSGKHLKIRTSGFVTVDKNGFKFLYCVYRDLTEEYHLFSRLKSFAENLPGLAFRYFLYPDGNDKITYLKTDSEQFDAQGWQGQLVESKNLWNRVLPEDRVALKEKIVKSAENNITFDAEWRSINKKGDVVWVRGVAQPIKNAENVVYWDVLVLNINERKETEQKRKLVSARLNLLVNGVEGIVWEANPKNFKFEFVSDQVQAILGYTPREWYEEKDFWQNHIHPEDRDAAVKYGIGETRACRNHTFEYRMRTKKGDYIWIQDRVNLEVKAGQSVLMRGIMLDVTEVKQKNRELELLSSVSASARDAIIITDVGEVDGNHNMIYVNESLLRLTGYSRDELLGESPKMFQGSLTGENELDQIRQALVSLKPVTVQVINYGKKGLPYWIEISITPAKNNKGKVSHFIGVQREITQIKIADLKDNIVAKISHIFNRHENLPELLEMVSGEIAQYPDADFAEAWLVNYDQTTIEVISSWIKSESILKVSENYNLREIFEKGKGLPGLVWERGQATHLEDSRKSKFSIRRELAKEIGIISVTGIPMLHGGEVLGVLMLGWKKRILKSEVEITLPLDIGEYLGTEIKRKKAEKELVQLFDTSRDIIGVIRKDKFIKLNNAAVDILGHNELRMLQNPMTYFVHSDDLSYTLKSLNKVREKRETVNFQNRFLTNRGEERFFEWIAAPGNERDLIFTIGRDITERRRLEKLLDKATNLANLGGWVRDMKSEKIKWSPNVLKIHEVKPSFVPTGENILQFFMNDEDRRRFSQNIKRAVKNGEGWDDEFEIKTAKGNLKWIRTIGEPEFVDGECRKITGSIQDIDKFKRDELGHLRKSSYLALISQLNVELLQNKDWDQALKALLPNLCKVVNADRSHYFSHQNGKLSQKLESYQPGIEPQMGNSELQNLPLDILGDFSAALISGTPYYSTISQVSNKVVTKLLKDQGIKSLLVYPIMVNKKLKGFIGFDDCKTERKWEIEETNLLKSVTDALSIAIENYQSSKALEKANKSRAKILESITDAFYSVNEKFDFTYFNHEAENLLGKSADEVLGENIWRVFPVAAKTDLKNNYEWALQNQESTSFEYLYPVNQIWFEVNVYPAKDGLSVYFKDITERIKGFKALAMSKERFERVAEATNDAIWDWDMEEETIFKGKGFETLFGQNPGVYPCSTNSSTVSTLKADRKRVDTSLNRAINNPKVEKWSEPYRFKRKDGTFAWVIDRGFIIRDSKGKAVRMVGSIQDVTRQKKYEESLKKLNVDLEQKSNDLQTSQKRYSDLFHLSPQPLLVFDIKTLKFLDVNAAAMNFYGYTQGEFLKLKVSDIKPAEPMHELEAAMKLNVKDNPGQSVGITAHKKKNGEVVRVDIRVSELDYKGTRARLALVIDVTERLNYIDTIEEKNKRLMEIAWTQSHVVRAPLARMLGLIDMLDDIKHAGMSRDEILKHISNSGRELDEVIRDITKKAENLVGSENGRADKRKK